MTNRFLNGDDLQNIWAKGVAAVSPELVVRNWVSSFFQSSDFPKATQRILVVGGGKAGEAMARGFLSAIPENGPKVEGWLNVPQGAPASLRHITLHPARPVGWNMPTAQAMAGSEEMLRIISTARPDDLLICLVSGGGSALMPLPSAGISLEDKQRVTSLLSAAGADISALNCVRKHLSRIKGGRLAEAFFHATRGQGRVISLILSDVIGDSLDVIASGPTVPDPTTFSDALTILDSHHLAGQVPASVLGHLQSGRDGVIPETPKKLSGLVHNVVLGNNAMALAAAQDHAEELGYPVLNLGSCLQGETRDLAAFHASLVRSILQYEQPFGPPVCIISGGETTVNLGVNPGKGGRNQEFALAFLEAMRGTSLDLVSLLAGGTDGEDGPTHAAGAFVSRETRESAQSLGLNSAEYLSRHDAFHFFEKAGGLFQPGPTGTNVMDLRVILIGPAGSVWKGTPQG